MRFLESLPAASRLGYVEYMESNNYSFFFDPVELDPKVRSALRELQCEANRLRDQGGFGRGMGSGGLLLAWVKQQLLERHGVTWKTPWEMNPDVAFD